MPDGRALCLHVGHGKTGSSYLQSAFAESVDSLAAAGLDYPVGWRLRRSAKGGISSGNALGLIHFLDGSDRAVAQFPPLRPGFAATLVSGETLFARLTRAATVQRLAAAAREAGYDRVRLLLFIRDPVSHAASVFQQAVKRGGFTGTVDEKAERFNHPMLVERCLDACEGVEGLELTVRNYSRLRADLLGAVRGWLGVPDDVLRPPPVAVVNRSLSPGELEFQRALNEVLGDSGEVLADALCEMLPDLRAEPVRPSRAAQQRLWARLEPVVARVNARIGAADGYRCDMDAEEPPRHDGFTFSREQVRVIAQALGAEIARQRARASGDEALAAPAVAAQGDMPQNRRLLLEMARTHVKADALDAAEATLRQLIAVAPDHAAAQTLLAKVLARAGRAAKAPALQTPRPRAPAARPSAP